MTTGLRKVRAVTEVTQKKRKQARDKAPNLSRKSLSPQYKVFCVGSVGYAHDAVWLNNFSVCHTLAGADIVIFPGGSDIDPQFYGEQRGKHTVPSEYYDKKHKEAFDEAVSLKKVIFGICRGHQLCVALSGGKLIQHVSGHHGAHMMHTSEDEVFGVNSIHHQMVFPYTMDDKDYEILGWAEPAQSEIYLNGLNANVIKPKDFVEIEAIVIYPTRCISVQWHPEMLAYSAGRDSKALKWLNRIVDKYYAILTVDKKKETKVVNLSDYISQGIKSNEDLEKIAEQIIPV